MRLVVAGVLLVACAKTGSKPARGDADSDSDTDSESGTGTDTGTGTESETDTGSETMTDTASESDTTPPFEGGTYRITRFEFTAPDVLVDDVVRGLVDTNIDERTMNWLIDLRDRVREACHYTTGSAVTDDLGVTYDWEALYPPVEGSAHCEDAGLRIPGADRTIDVIDIPVKGEILLVFRIREAFLEATFGMDPEVTGTMTGKITVAEADDVPLGDLGATLCGLLAGDAGALDDYDDDCANLDACLDGRAPPDAGWDCDTDGNAPDTEAAGEPAWTLEADYDATSAALVGA